jgi:Skp family chaperone for outer membrane proteins
VDKGLLTTSVAQAQYQKLQQQQQEYQEYAVRKQQEMAEEQQVMMNQIANAIAEFVTEYNETHQYALILSTSGNILSTPVVCGDPRLDITEDFLAGLNAAYIKTKETTKK